MKNAFGRECQSKVPSGNGVRLLAEQPVPMQRQTQRTMVVFQYSRSVSSNLARSLYDRKKVLSGRAGTSG